MTMTMYMNIQDQAGWSKKKFPAKLFQLLAVLDDPRGNTRIIRGGSLVPVTDKHLIGGWNLDGRSFRINNSDHFVRDCMPFFFNQTKYKSFQRQLNIYGFKRITSGNFKGSYFHPGFGRGDSLSKVNMIQRRKQDSERTPDEISNGIRLSSPSPMMQSLTDGSNTIVNSIRLLGDQEENDDSIFEAMSSVLSPLQNHPMGHECVDFTVARPPGEYVIEDDRHTPTSLLACINKNNPNSIPRLVPPTRTTIMTRAGGMMCNGDCYVTDMDKLRSASIGIAYHVSKVEQNVQMHVYRRHWQGVDVRRNRTSEDDAVDCDGIPIAELDCFDVDNLFTAVSSKLNDSDK